MAYQRYGYKGLEHLDRALHYSGVNWGFAGLEAAGAGYSAISGGMDSLNAFWDRGSGYQELGNTFGEVSAGLMGATVSGMWARDSMLRMGGVEGYKGNGSSYSVKKNGNLFNRGTGTTITDSKAIKDITKAKGMAHGNWMKNGGGFRKHMNWKFGIGAVVGSMVAGMALTAAGNMIGATLDDMTTSHRSGQQLSYDNRRFSSQFDSNSVDQFGQQSIGTGFKAAEAMNEMQKRMISVARIYHA